MSSIAPLSELIPALKRKECTAYDIIEQVRRNINDNETDINAFINVFLEQAQTQALELDNKNIRPNPKKPLAGLPIAIKDNICVKGESCTCASKILADFISPYDATVVKRLKNAGAIIIGKTNLDEFAMGSSNETSTFGVVRNPLDKTKVAGGSSGGSAAVIAYGGAAAALGSDTGGSARQPAAFCGLVGFRPSYGRVSRYGLVAFASSLDQICPITQTVEDAALIYSIIAGPDENDSTTYPQTPDIMELTEKLPQGTRIAYIKECFDDLDSEMKQAIMRPFQDTGIDLIELSLPLVKQSVAAYLILTFAEASSNLARYDGIRYGLRVAKKGLMETYFATRGQGLGKEVKRRILIGTFGLSEGYIDAYYNTALKYRAALSKQYADAFAKVDFLLSPTAPSTAFKIGEKKDNPLSMYLSDIYTTSNALAALPSISIPSPYKIENLPVGIQLTAPRRQDAKLLGFAHALERHF